MHCFLFLQVGFELLQVYMNILPFLHSLHSLPSLASQILVNVLYSRCHIVLPSLLLAWFLSLLVFYFVHLFLPFVHWLSILAIQCLGHVFDIRLIHCIMDCLNWYWWLLVFYFVRLFLLRLHHILFLAIQYLEHVSDSLHIFVCMHPSSGWAILDSRPSMRLTCKSFTIFAMVMPSNAMKIPLFFRSGTGNASSLCREGWQYLHRHYYQYNRTGSEWKGAWEKRTANARMILPAFVMAHPNRNPWRNPGRRL